MCGSGSRCPTSRSTRASASSRSGKALAGLLRESPRNPAEVLSLYADHLATTVISCDSPRYLAFIPAAPSKASLLFDMVVSAASLQGISWLEASGAIAAENQALRWIADLAGLPATAGGVFVTGGSAANLSALAVARDVGRARRDLAPGVTARVAVSDQAHSSVRNTLHLLGMTAFPVPTPDHRLTGEALRAALDADPVRCGLRRCRRRHLGDDERRHHRRPRGRRIRCCG